MPVLCSATLSHEQTHGDVNLSSLHSFMNNRQRYEQTTLTYEQTAGVSEGRLGPDEPGAVGLLRRAVDEAAPDPGGAHGQHPHEQPDVATSQHHLGAEQY